MKKKEREILKLWNLKAIQMCLKGHLNVENTMAFYRPSFGECLVAMMFLAKQAFCRRKGALFILIGKANKHATHS